MTDEVQPPGVPQVGPWAKEKLERLGKYLHAYTTIMKKQKWCDGYVYVDAFAGAGDAAARQVDEEESPAGPALLDLGEEPRNDQEAQELLAGSPRVALGIQHPFTHYVFVEMNEDRRAVLERLRGEFPGRSVLIRAGDCNSYLREHFIDTPRVDWRRWRGIVFLDPFGMQVPWSTVEGLAATGAIEVFLNFPVGMAIQRLLKRSGQFTAREREKLDDYFGDPGWYEVVYEESQDLFGQTVVSKPERSGDRLVSWYRDRLRTAFGHVSVPYLVRNTRGGHLYYLLFAGPNSQGAKIASHVLKGGERRLVRR